MTDNDLREYVKELKFKAHPWFCEHCQIIRNTEDKTFLNAYEQLMYYNRGMCTKCFKYLADHNGEEDLENRIKIYEDVMQTKIKRGT